jgi:GNAT superfamily N-acetyltransferase
VSAPADTTLRLMERDDRPAVEALVWACDESWREWAPAGWEPPAIETQRWITHLGEADRWTRVAVEHDGRLVGLASWGAARVGPEWRVLPGVAHLGALFVHPSRWRRGLASWLLDAALDAMRRGGYVRARLNTPVGAPAERLYAARGWARALQPSWHEVVKLPSIEYTIDL